MNAQFDKHAGTEEMESKAQVDRDEAREVEAAIEGGAEGDEVQDGAPSDPLEEARKEAEIYKDRWMRLAAEFENYKRRTAREFDALVQSANEGLIRDLLPVLDGVDRALAHGGEAQAGSDGFQEGVRMIMEQLPKVLRGRGLEEIEAVGTPFDPNVHEALLQMESEEYEAGVVASAVEKGYRLGNRVIRPAKVVVSRGQAEGREAASGDGNVEK